MKLKAARQRVAELNAEIADVTKKRAAIGNAAIAEKRSLTDEERASFTELAGTIETLAAQLAEAKELLEAAEAANEADRTAGVVVPDPDAQAAHRGVQAARIEVGTDELDKKAKAPGHFGRQLQAIRRIAIGEPSADDQTVIRQMRAAATGMNTDVPSDGGFLVAPDRSNTILQRAYEIGQVLSRVARMPIGAGSNGMKVPAIDETSRADGSRFGGIASGWLGQGNTLSSGKPKFREIDLKLRKVGAFVYATDEQLADAVALEGWISRYLPLELQFRTEDAFINGVGSNQPLGVLNSPALITVTRAQASHVTYDDVAGMWARLYSPLRGNAVWLCDQSVEKELEQISIAIGTAGVLAPIYKPAGSTPGQVYATLYGRPVIPVEYCAALGTTGDLILQNFDEYLVIDKGGVEQAVSIHVAFLTDESVFRFMYRVDGQPAWNSALTPKSGSSTLSCSVVLS